MAKKIWSNASLVFATLYVRYRILIFIKSDIGWLADKWLTINFMQKRIIKNGYITSICAGNFIISSQVFNVHGSVHRESMSIIVQQDATMYCCLYFCKLLYMFRVVTPPIIRSTYNSNYNIWHWPNFGKCSVWSQLTLKSLN